MNGSLGAGRVVLGFHSLYLVARKNGILEGHYHNLGKKLFELPKLMSKPETILLMDNGRLNIITEIEIKEKKCIISVELDTVKDINNKNSAYNLIISVFSAKNNYIRNNIKKHAVDIKYKKDGLLQVNSQLYEWLAIINDKPSSADTLPHNNQKSKNSEKNDFNARDINDPKIIENEVSSLKLASVGYDDILNRYKVLHSNY